MIRSFLVMTRKEREKEEEEKKSLPLKHSQAAELQSPGS
jgi:hypothetical protein